jgi:hypothetical protein
MKTASWIILTIVGALTLQGSLFSLALAYSSAQGPDRPSQPRRAVTWQARGGHRRACPEGNSRRLRSRVRDTLPGHYASPLPPRRSVGVVGALGKHACCICVDPSPSTFPGNPTRDRSCGYRGGHGPYDSRSVGSSGPWPGSRSGSFGWQQTSGLSRASVSFGRLQLPSSTNKAIKPIRRSSVGIQSRMNYNRHVM